MSNKKSGLFPVLVGAVAGVAAVFFSDKKNREKVNKAVTKGKAQLKKLSLEITEDPKAFAKKVGTKVSKEAKKVSEEVAKEVSKEVSKEAKKLNEKVTDDQKKSN